MSYECYKKLIELFLSCAWISPTMSCGYMVHIITFCPLSWNGSWRCYINSGVLQIKKISKRGESKGYVRAEKTWGYKVSTIKALTCVNIGCISTHGVICRYQLDTGLGTTWAFRKATYLLSGIMFSVGLHFYLFEI